MRVTRRTVVLLIGLVALAAAGAWSVHVGSRSEPVWVVWARTAEDGTIDVREDTPDGPAAAGEWVSAGREGSWGAPDTAAIDEVSESHGWRAWANRLGLRRRWATRWHRVPPQRADGWAAYVESFRPEDGSIDPALAGPWTLARALDSPGGNRTFGCRDIELRPDGTIGGRNAHGSWRVLHGALGIHWHASGTRRCVMVPVEPGRLYRTAASADELRRR